MKTRAWDGKQFRYNHFVGAGGGVYQTWCLNSGHNALSRVNWQLSQHIGMKDIDGIDVWEFNIYEHLGYKYMVVFKDGRFILSNLHGHVANQGIWLVEHLKCIGNKFENPEFYNEI